MRALAIAATGMAAQQTNVDVIANNIANINTTGVKRARRERAEDIAVPCRGCGAVGGCRRGARTAARGPSVSHSSAISVMMSLQ